MITTRAFLNARLFAVLLALLAVSDPAHAQLTVGTLLNTEYAMDGYTLFGSNGTSNVFLVNNCGEVVNEWSGSGNKGGSYYLLEDGSLIMGLRLTSPYFFGGGAGGRLERYSWEGDLIWAYDFADESHHHHHDFSVMPNGHILVLAWESHTHDEAVALGRNPALTADVVWSERIMEIVPIGSQLMVVAWQWRLWDHLVQDFDPDAPDYGDPADFPGRFDINYDASASGGQTAGMDWMHMNAIEYNEELDQILLSSRNWDEIYIVDHGLTETEAAGEAGDLMWRWGNPAAYGLGTPADRMLYGQHNPTWLPTAGEILLYNNGNGRPEGNFSTVERLELPLLDDGTYALGAGQAYGPEAYTWRYPEVLDQEFYSPNVSGAQLLENGNIVVCEGASGHFFEIATSGEASDEMVWDYISPDSPMGPMTQGDDPTGNGTFRVYRYEPDYPAFDGVELVAGAPVELNPDPSACNLYPSNVTEWIPQRLRLAPNPARDRVQVEIEASGRLEVLDVRGRPVYQTLLSPGRHEIALNSSLSDGLYLVRFTWAEGVRTERLLVTR